ncbi:MAG TPA: VWA domain-containing protein, partial [Bacteroidales bacterium]|nr:VWA domain-containing protein [Bacteroidales bacterium]
LFLLILIPILIAWYVWKRKKYFATLQISSVAAFSNMKPTFKVWARHILFIIRMLALILLIIVMARPQSSNSWKNISTKGIDIILDMDISGSMLAQDFKPNRLEAAKEVAIKFINGRPNDRVGLVVFSGESFTQCPLTTDHASVINLMKDIKSGMIEDGTAIGEGLANGIRRLKDSPAKSKVIILLTDGINNMGAIDPLTAAEIAKTFNIRIYTIGIGSRGMAPYPIQTPFGMQYQQMKVEIDETLLQRISDETGGKYFRATNKKKLEDIYKEIDKLEKSKIKIKEYRKKNDEYLWWGIIAILLLTIEGILRYTVFRSIT